MSETTPSEPSAPAAPGDGSAPGTPIPSAAAAPGDASAPAPLAPPRAPAAPARLQPPTVADEVPAAAPAATDAGSGLAAIATWSAPGPATDGQVPLSARTGEPTRIATIWVATIASYLAAAVTGAATLWVYWDAVNRFHEASWLMAQFETEPGSLARVLLSVAVTAIALVIGTATAITGYYAYDGRRWTRWSALVAFAVSLLAFLLIPLAWAAPGLTAIAAVALWLPPSARFFAAWQAFRRHDPVFSQPPSEVVYGPLPRYR